MAWNAAVHYKCSRRGCQIPLKLPPSPLICLALRLDQKVQNFLGLIAVLLAIWIRAVKISKKRGFRKFSAYTL